MPLPLLRIHLKFSKRPNPSCPEARRERRRVEGAAAGPPARPVPQLHTLPQRVRTSE